MSLPILDNLRVAAPCAADWSKMTGDARVRHCTDCNKSVYNLSEMTREEAQALLVEHSTTGTLCVRYYRRNDGTILSADCPVGTKRRRPRRWVAFGAVAMLAGAVSGWFVKRRADERHRDELDMMQVQGSVDPPMEHHAPPTPVPDVD